MRKNVTFSYCLLQAGYWTLAAVAMAYTTPILEAKGYSGVEIGMLSAVKYASVLAFQMILGSFSDKHAKTFPLKYLIILLTVISMAFAYLFWASDHNMLLAILIFIVFGATVNCVSPLVDSLSIQYMNHGYRLNYALSRGCGSLAWAVFCVIVGMISDRFGSNQILLFQILMSLVFIGTAAMTEKVDFAGDAAEPIQQPQNTVTKPREQSQSVPQRSEVHSTGYLLCHYPKFVLFLVAVMLIFMGYNMNVTFLVDRMEALGGNHFDYGMGQFVLAVAEIPVALGFYQLRKRFSLDQLMIICAVFCTLRAFATAFATTPTVLIWVQGLEILGFSIYYAGSVFYVMDNLPAQDSVKGTSLINLAGMGLGEMLGSLVCGYLRDLFGLQAVMNVSVAVSAAGIGIMCLMTRAKQFRT